MIHDHPYGILYFPNDARRRSPQVVTKEAMEMSKELKKRGRSARLGNDAKSMSWPTAT